MSRPGQSYEPPLFAWNVGSIVAEICERAGVPYDRYETALLEGSVEGFSHTSDHSASSAIEALAGIFMFDPANHSGILHFVPRGEPSVMDIDPQDMVEDRDATEKSTRRDSITIPKTIHLEYYDTTGGLTADKQTSDRSIDERSKSESTTQTVIVMRADDAARAVVVSHKVGIEEQRGEVSFSLPQSYLELSTADVITLSGSRLRITEVDIDDAQQTYTCLYDRASSYESTIQGVPIDEPSEPPGLVIGESVLEVIEAPIIQSSDDELGYYVAVSSLTPNWTGAVVELSMDGGANWVDGDGIQVNAIMGHITSALPAHAAEYPDRRNVVTLDLLRDDMQLIPATLAEMKSRANLAIIGNELINFGDVEQTGDLSWKIGNLLRGRKGTAASAHASGERFVLMNAGMATQAIAERYQLGRDLTFRVTSYGLEPGTDTQTITFAGTSQKERQPAYLKAKRVGSDLQLTWQGVGRLGGGVNVGMGAYFIGFRVTLGSTTWETLSTSLTIPYAAGTLSLQQINSITGLGPAITVTV